MENAKTSSNTIVLVFKEDTALTEVRFTLENIIECTKIKPNMIVFLCTILTADEMLNINICKKYLYIVLYTLRKACNKTFES